MDHETSGAQEWQLVGYGRSSTKPYEPTRQTSSTQPGELLPPNNPRNEGWKSPHTAVAANNGGPANSYHKGTAKAVRGQASSRFKQPYKSRGTRPVSNKIFHDSPAKAAWRAGDKPTGQFNLPTTYGVLRDQFSGIARSTMLIQKSQGTGDRHALFYNIHHKTGCYVKTPSYSDKVIYLWGQASQVASAQDILQSILAKCSFSAPSKKSEWAKVSAKNPTKEATAELKERREHKIMKLRNEPEDIDTFLEELKFMWPKEGPSLLESLGPKLEVLDVIRAQFNCHLFVPKDSPGMICAVDSNHDNIKRIVHCLRTKWREVMASSNIKLKAYVVEPPVADVMKKKIVMRHESSCYAKPLLRGNRLKGLEMEEWASRATLIQSKNNVRMLSALQKSLEGVVFVRGHLRMRINLGLFVLDEYRAPVNDKTSYTFEEFREMLSYEQTRGRLFPGLKISPQTLLTRCFEASHLLEPYESTSSSLAEIEPVYSVNFEFSGANNSMLRLEVEFSKIPCAAEYEVTQRRWLRPRKGGHSGDRQSPLQIGVINFMRPDWQLEIKSLEFHDGHSIDSSLKSFSSTIGFRRSSDDIDFAAEPCLRVTYSPDSPPISRLVEKTAIRYRLKETNYVLEVARYDEYTQPGSCGIVADVSEASSTSWGASIFDPRWDNLFGEHANLPVGHHAKYNPDMDTFFPPRDTSSSEKGKGFCEFIDLVKQVGELLKPENGSGDETVFLQMKQLDMC